MTGFDLSPPTEPHPRPGPTAPSGPRPSIRERRGGKRKRGRGFVVGFLLANLIPAAACVWFFTRPEEDRKKFLDAIPAGVGGRVLAAGIAFGVLLVLALVVLPGAKATLDGLKRARIWFRTRPRGLRIALYPLEILAGLAWFLVQCLFAIDAILILAAGAAFLLFVVRIVKPDALPWLGG